MLLLGLPTSFELFSIGAILYCLCLVPIGLTRLPAPQTPAGAAAEPRAHFQASPVGAAGCLTVGLANGAFWTLAPLYAQSLGFTTRELALFMSVFIAGGAIVQWPLGRLSDGMDRRWIIAATCTAAAACGLVLGSVGQLLVNVPALFYFVVFVFGAVALPLYSLSVAHANDRLPRARIRRSVSGAADDQRRDLDPGADPGRVRDGRRGSELAVPVYRARRTPRWRSMRSRASACANPHRPRRATRSRPRRKARPLPCRSTRADRSKSAAECAASTRRYHFDSRILP